MEEHEFYHVPTPFDTTGKTIKFAGRNGSKEKTEWYRANINDKGQLVVTYNSHHSLLKREKNCVYSSKFQTSLNNAEDQAQRERVAKVQQERAQKKAEEEERIRLKKAAYSRERFDKASEKGTSSYLQRKGVKAHGIRFENLNGETSILIPMRDKNGEIQALQVIFPSKRAFVVGDKPRDKHFTNSVKGLSHVLGDIVDGQLIRVSEGYATAASCYESTGCTVPHVVSFSDGAYSTIVPLLREKYLNSNIQICADASKDPTKKSSGVIEAEKALNAIGNRNCWYVIPEFSEGNNKDEKGEQLKDFNDLMIAEGTKEVNAQIEQAPPRTQEATKDLSTIEITSGNLPEMTDKGEAILIESKAGIYQRSGKLVRIVVESTKPKVKNNRVYEKIRRPEDALVIAEVDYIHLTEVLGKIAKWARFDERSKELKQKDCPEKVSKTLIARRQWDLPVLSGIIQAPTLRPDGSILDTPGYDEETGLFFNPGQTQFTKIPTNPSKEDAEKALNVLLEVISEFPFVGDESKSVSLSAILTALIRKAIRTAPLHGFTAPKMASGKSLLADVVGLVATGKVNCAIPQADSETEEKKRVLAVLAEGDPVVCFDNIERPFGSAAMCSILTQTEYKDRVLGSTRNLNVLTNTTFLATGNNLTFVGDISTRTIMCRLDPKVERPEERTFEKNLYQYIPQHRVELVTAALTILRAYHVAGRPKQNIAPFGRFEEWSDFVRSALIWVGMADPCTSRKEIENSDPVRVALGSCLESWYAVFEDKSKRVKDVVRKIEEPTADLTNEEQNKLDALREALIEIAPGERGGINSRSLGKKFATFKGRIENGYRLDSHGTYQGVETWRVTKVDE